MPEVQLKQDYWGIDEPYNPLISLLIMELRDALIYATEQNFDGNCNLDIISQTGVAFRIFVDCGDFDYIDQCILPDGTKLDFGCPELRQVEFNVGDVEIKHFKRVVKW